MVRKKCKPAESPDHICEIARLPRHPRHRLRHRASRVKADKLVRGQSRVRKEQQNRKNNEAQIRGHDQAHLHKETLLTNYLVLAFDRRPERTERTLSKRVLAF